MQAGTLTIWFEDRGFRFIRPNQAGSDVFVHIADIWRSGLEGTEVGQRMALDIQADARGGRDGAVNLTAEERG